MTDDMKIVDRGMSRNHSALLKGLFSILVIFCHVRGEITSLNGTLIGKLFTQFGYLSVSVFLFLSGYGLWKSKERKADYLTKFVRHRIIPLYLQYSLVVCFYAIVFWVIERPVDIQLVAQSFVFGRTLVPYGWYFQAIIIFYLLFYFGSVLGPPKKVIACIAIGLSLYTILCVWFKLTSTWYESTFSFLLGMIVANNEEKIVMYKKGKELKWLILLIGVSVVTILLGALKELGLIFLIIKMISSISFSFLVYYIVIRYRLLRRGVITSTLKQIGNRSFEVYALQGFVIQIFFDAFPSDTSPIFFLIAVTVVIVLCAIIVHPMFTRIGRL